MLRRKRYGALPCNLGPGAPFSSRSTYGDVPMAFQLPSLPSALDALAAKGMSQETLEYHYGKHHNAYVVALNGFVEKNADLQGKSLEQIVQFAAGNDALAPVFNNAGQIWNHNMYWLSLSPTGGKLPGALEKKVTEDFGSVTAFKEQFKAAATGQFGSGWAWLVLDKSGKLKITKTGNAGSPLASNDGKTLLTIDVWEHAYYIDFRNRRPDFVQNLLDNLLNYEYAAAQLDAA